jgi:methyl coenzyme M reductase alpha subunit
MGNHAFRTASVLIAAGSALAVVAGGAAAQDQHRFTFSQAEYMSMGGMRAARAFVAENLPAGIPMRKAIARAERADTSCKPVADGVDCEYFIMVRPAGGDLGEDVWAVHLHPGPEGLLQAADVHRYRVGMNGYLGGR